MTLLEWRDEFRTGIDGVDYEHEALIARINAVYGMIENSAARIDVVDGLGEIYGAIAAHFALEEQMMRRTDYPEYAEHRADHERLLDEIREIADDYEQTVDLDRNAFQRRLSDWFQNHFSTHDARLHRMAGMRQHDPVSTSMLRGMIDYAKQKFLGQDR
jgi:hemerythrin-like metal-binding protein